MKYWVFTFGFGQGNDHGYVKVYANSWNEARDKMVDAYGIKWGFQYDSEDEAGVSRFNLKLVRVIV